jgi:hypothetical protein
MCCSQLRTGPFACPPSSEKRPEWTLDDPVGRLRQPDPCWALTRPAIGSAIVEEAPTVVPSGRWPHPDVPGGPDRRGVR